MALDAGLRLLNQYGYNLVERPEVQLAPMDVLGRDDVLERIGPLPTLIGSSTIPPTAGPLQLESAFLGHRTDNVHISSGGRLLLHLLNGFGSRLKVGQLISFVPTARFVRLEFSNVLSSGVPPAVVAHWLQSARPIDGAVADRYFFNSEADAFLVTDVIQCDAVSVLPLDFANKPVAVDIPALQGSLGANVAVGSREAWITFQGPTPATVAFKCSRLASSRNPPTAMGWFAMDPQPTLIGAGTRVMVR